MDNRRHIVNVSGGKDSVAMLLRMLELGQRVDEILFMDSQLELSHTYKYLDKLESHIGRKITRLRSEKNFFRLFYTLITRGKMEGRIRGFPMVNFPCWWERDGKGKIMDRHNRGQIVYVGYAADEERRLKRFSDKGKNIEFRFPLIEWGWEEKDCFEYLEKKNLVNPIYRQGYKRNGCWLCPRQNKEALGCLYNNYPDLWRILRTLEEDSPLGFGFHPPLNKLEKEWNKKYF